MKQILQSFKTGETLLEEIPSPQVSEGQILIRTTRSLVSLGTERMLVEFGKANLIQKARQQPERVKEVLDKVKTEGLVPTMEAVFNKLGQPLPLGYCNVGRVIAVGSGVNGFKVGDRVTSNGPHAEFVSVPQNLVAHIPDNVTDEEATFTVIGSIGLQGIRLINPTFGEVVVVTGLGLIGLIASELLIANGCTVIGIDFDEEKLKIAKEKGIITINPSKGDDPVNFVNNYTNGVGADAVLITASTKSNDVISQSAKMSRQRGRIVLIGVIGLDINRADFYEKELSFQVSCSYGPGRYDEKYEQKGQDYPLSFVRWTEKRNFETILNSISTKRIDVKSLITEIVDLNNYFKIYDNIGGSKSIASILKYKDDTSHNSVVQINSNNFSQQKGIVGIIGSGNFTKMTILPTFKKINANVKYIASKSGVNSTALAKQYNISNSTSDYKEILNDSQVDTVLVTTRHNSHSKFVLESLQANKNVFVEKPLALSKEELKMITEEYQKHDCTLTVGFNRRFSPHIQKIKSYLGNGDDPINITATMNAGFIPSNSWVQDMKTGGGRIIGEACHYIDLLVYLTGSKVKSICMNALGSYPEENTDNASILLKFENGSNGVINYFSNGAKSYQKERLEVFSQNRVFVMDNFRLTKGYGVKGFNSMKTSIDKGHKRQFELLIDRIITGGEALIPYDEIINVTEASFGAIESLKSNSWINIR